MNKFLQRIKKNFPLLVIIGFAFGIGWYFYPDLPARVPSHWNIRGEIDGYSSRFWGAFGLPLMMLGCWISFEILPFIDPKKENYGKFSKAYSVFKYALTVLFFGLFIIVIMTAQGYPVNINVIMPLGLSILFIIIGNYLTTLRHNYSFGIRTPWTLANEEVWRRTHRITGRLWVGSGIVSIIAVLFNAKYGGMAVIVLIIGTALFSVVYSWWCFNRLKNE